MDRVKEEEKGIEKVEDEEEDVHGTNREEKERG